MEVVRRAAYAGSWYTSDGMDPAASQFSLKVHRVIVADAMGTERSFSSLFFVLRYSPLFTM
jgi:hypothetical protein